ncbi:DNA polymerase V [Lachnospiraceae bacterium PF1-21]|uniref:Y-family DNA polymerase n=1 Tax=Ohessyouella blattaphilus TaxID=2949333 RepID=UPI003E1A3647
MSRTRQYIAIDLKSFYASVECVERGLDPLKARLVVADASRTSKTICLAVSPALKAYGIPGRPRLFEVEQKVKGKNVDYITAVPRMSLYLEYSTRIYNIYLKYIAPEDIHVYSIDEVFIDATTYLKTYQLSAKELARKMIKEVLAATGITATAGIGTNLYLSKVAMDIMAKKSQADADGVRIAQLDEQKYKEELWDHQPLRDFWRVGYGYQKKLHAQQLFTMGDIARCSLGKADDYYNEDLLYKLFGINAELLIDHAWGYEPCTMSDIKAYKPAAHSVGSGQVLHEPYPYEKARLIVREMTELLVLDLVDKKLVTDQVVLTVGYDKESLSDPQIARSYRGEVKVDYYGRKIPKHAHGTANLSRKTSSTMLIVEGVMELFARIVDERLLVRRVTIAATRVMPEAEAKEAQQGAAAYGQLDLFTDYEALKAQQEKEDEQLEKEKQLQRATLALKKKYGKNAVLKGMNLEDGGTTISRNDQIGGHKA